VNLSREAFKEAFEMGWVVESEEAGFEDFDEDEKLRTGEILLTKEVGMYSLTIHVPFRAVCTYDQPCRPEATVGVARSGSIEGGNFEPLIQ
jgi:hypothetical protein